MLYRKIANPALNRLKRALALIIETTTMPITTSIGTKYVMSHNIDAVSRDGQIDNKNAEKSISERSGFGRFLGSISTPFIADDDTDNDEHRQSTTPMLTTMNTDTDK
jgi:hypothetical protein